MAIASPASQVAAGSTAPVHSHRLCVLYDAGSGHILHTHRVLTLVGGAEPSEEQINADARQAASRRHPGAAALAALHLSHDAMSVGEHYKVDLTTQTLVALPRR